MKIWSACIVLAWSTHLMAIEKPEGVVFCHDQTLIEFAFVHPNQNNDVLLTINKTTQRLMTAYSWFGQAQPAPKGFKFAILGQGQLDPLFVFEDYLEDAKNNRYVKCN